MFDSSIVGNISVLAAFIEGLVSFFSPCVIPLLPIYLGYLSGGLEEKKPSRKKTVFFTLAFIAGIFTALLLLNVSITWISSFFTSASIWIMRIGGILIIFLGLVQLGLLKIPFFERTFHFNVNFAGKRMNVLLAFVMGFTFSFSWTPCIGPALASILILASSSGSFLTSTLLVIAYAIGFALPFLVISFFSTQVMKFFHTHVSFMKYIVKVGAVILILMGGLMFFGKLGYLGGADIPTSTEHKTNNEQDGKKDTENEKLDAPQFSLQDQHGNTVNLVDYKGKVIYLNFWGTWCGVCEKELPEVQKLYDTYKDSDSVAVITVVLPNSGQELDIPGIQAYLKEKNVTFPVLFDTQGEVFSTFGIRSFPTVFMIDKEYHVFGYLNGGIDYDTMEKIIAQTIEGKMEK